MTISILSAAFSALYLILLSIHVIKGRRKFKVALGTEGSTEITRRIRAHANFTEYTPFFMMLLAANEYLGLHTALLVTMVVIFFLGRIMHSYSLLKHEDYTNGQITKTPVWRIRAMVCTFNVIGFLAISAIVLTITEKL